ncbi:PAS domain-containing protein [Streptomyces sp. NP160]|uniref:SpoIIE family protein phosphatase n=1 Tax=Streptomyces sp. NP160 TaxID=2586637 RepID=UPI0011183133|nr:SpoIIE family protein phosphatase [Streptomyces sp. NP160]TNM67262.1 PAS domain-containing protein [Streptomyces sp. NP160]
MNGSDHAAAAAPPARRAAAVVQVQPDASAAVLMVDLPSRSVLYANDVATQMAPGLSLPVSVDAWATAADLRDLDGEPLDETAHPLSRIARFEPVAGQGVSAARRSDLGERREPLWVVALPLDDAPNLAGHALVVFLPVAEREALQQRAEDAHAAGVVAEASRQVGAAAGDGVAVREAAVLATGLSFTVADARTPDMPLVWVNPAFTAVTGYTFEETVGTNCRFLQGAATDRAATRRIRAALRAGEPITETLLNFRADGTAFWNQVALSPVHDADGVLSHYVGIQTDVSARVAADAERDSALVAAREARAEAEAARGEAEAARADVEGAHARLQLLAEVTRQLSEVVDPQQALERLAHLVVPSIADFAILAVVSDGVQLPVPTRASQRAVASGARGGRLGMHDVAWWHRDPAALDVLAEHARTRLTSLTPEGRQALASLVGPDAQNVVALPAPADAAAVGAAPQDGEDDEDADVDVVAMISALLAPGPARRSLEQLAPASMVTLPLRSRGRTLGLMTLGTDGGLPPLRETELSLGADIAARAGLALDRARLFRQQRDLAEGLQRALLDLSPTAAPGHVQVAVRYVAAAEAAAVGGDFYDVFTQPDGAAVAVIGDVMGHDTQAAAAMSQLRTIVRTLGMVGTDDPRQVLTRADEVMRASGVETTATAAVVRVAVPEHDEPALEDVPGAVEVQWSNAGHPPPVVVDAEGRVSLLEASTTDLLMGVDPGTHRRLHRTRLAPGALLLLYTDGLVERRGQALSEGIARLQVVVAEAVETCGDLEELVDAVLAQMLPAASSDDVAVLAVCLS